MKRVCHVRLGRPQTPDVSASMRVEEEEKDACKNRNRLCPQIAVVVRSLWPCHRFAVHIGAEMLHEEGPTFCQHRWHRRETVLERVF